MKISVIVPVYNASKYIDKLIQSVVHQTYQNYELILVDDGSTDNSFEMIEAWSKKNDKIFAYTKENTGPGYTRKFGFEKATGDLVFFVDSDDWVTNDDVFYSINEIFQQYTIDILFFDREDIVGEHKEVLSGFQKVSPGFHPIEELCDSIRSGLGAKIFKRKLLTSGMFIESDIYEDLYTSYLYLDGCQNFYYIDECYYTIYHDTNSSSLSSIKNLNDFVTYKKAVNIVLSLYNKLRHDILKYSLSSIMPSIFIKYNKIRKIKYDKDLACQVYEMMKILKHNKVSYNSSKLKYLKNIYYKIMLKQMSKNWKH